MDWACCNSCGWKEAPSEEEAPNAVFYHAQAAEAAFGGAGDEDKGNPPPEQLVNSLWLGWRGDASAIVDALNAEGLHADWNGSEDTKVEVKSAAGGAAPPRARAVVPPAAAHRPR